MGPARRRLGEVLLLGLRRRAMEQEPRRAAGLQRSPGQRRRRSGDQAGVQAIRRVRGSLGGDPRRRPPPLRRADSGSDDVLRHRLGAADPEDRRRRRLARAADAAVGSRREHVRCVSRGARRTGGSWCGDPPGRSRPLPLLRGARAPVRGARIRRTRIRLLRPHGRHRPAGRRVRVRAARRADDRRRRAGRRTCGGRRAEAARGGGDLQRRLLLRRPRLVAGGGVRPRPRRCDRLLRQPDTRAGRTERRRSRERDGLPHPRPAGRRRRGHHGGGQRGIRRCACRGRCRARDRDVRRSPAQLLRPEAGGIPGSLRRRLAPRAGFVDRLA